MLFAECKFERGSGIGTRLFPWARCTIFSNNNSIPMLPPGWVQPRIGPFLRGGIDLRSYHRQILLMGLFTTSPMHSSYFDKIYAKTFFDKVAEPDDFTGKYSYQFTRPSNCIIEFEGDKGRFKYLNGFDMEIHRFLREITTRKWLDFVDSFRVVPIGINIRLGNDFREPKSIDDFYRVEATRTPIHWFVESLKSVRKMLGFDAAAFIVTDGTIDQISDLLALPNTHFIRPGCAISDLLVLAKSKILIRSGGSSFSAWASFLGQMPTISHEGQSMKEFNMVNKNGFYTGEFIPSNPPIEFMNTLKKIDFKK